MVGNRFTSEEIYELSKRYTVEYHKSHGGSGIGQQIYFDTTANWNAQPDLIAENGSLYIYGDKEYDASGGSITSAGMKIGDGAAYLIDTPFLDELIVQEVVSRIYQMFNPVTEEQRRFWNNKVSVFLDQYDHENLVFSKTKYILTGDIYNG